MTQFRVTPCRATIFTYDLYQMDEETTNLRSWKDKLHLKNQYFPQDTVDSKSLHFYDCIRQTRRMDKPFLYLFLEISLEGH